MHWISKDNPTVLCPDRLWDTFVWLLEQRESLAFHYHGRIAESLHDEKDGRIRFGWRDSEAEYTPLHPNESKHDRFEVYDMRHQPLTSSRTANK